MSCHPPSERMRLEKHLYEVRAEMNSRSFYRISRIVTIASLLHAEIEVCLETGPNSSES